jgi:rSAM/selenodomain-associated transferase 2
MLISVIIPVFHEQEQINNMIRHIYSVASHAAPEIIVVDGSIERDTLAAVSDKNVKGVSSDRGRAKQMNKGAAQARGDMLLFLHADTQLPVGAFEDIASIFEDDRCVGGAFDLAIDGAGLMLRVIERAASFRSRFTRVPYGDQAIFIKRYFFAKIGGYREMPLMEDIDLMKRIRLAGGRISIIRKRVKTSGRRWLKEGVVHCTLRNWAIRFLYLTGVDPNRLVKWYA